LVPGLGCSLNLRITSGHGPGKPLRLVGQAAEAAVEVSGAFPEAGLAIGAMGGEDEASPRPMGRNPCNRRLSVFDGIGVGIYCVVYI
jgi:hypothetical protein